MFGPALVVERSAFHLVLIIGGSSCASRAASNNKMSNTQSEYSVLPLLLPSGERLPCLIESATWTPTGVATRWAVRYRRNRVQSSTLAGDLRHLGKAYSWAKAIAKIDLDDFLCSGLTLDARQIESLAAYVREPSEEAAKNLHDTPRNKKIESEASAHDYLDAGSFDNALSVLESFFKWSLDAANRGGRSLLTFQKLILERSRLELIFDQLRIGAAQSHRIEPLEEREVEDIRKAIGPSETTDGWKFPRVFAPGTRLRNWLMFETALELGIRRGELLKLKVASLPRGSDTGIRVIRYPDDPEDTRAREPAVKTAERILPPSISGPLTFDECLFDHPATARPDFRQDSLSIRDSDWSAHLT